MSNVVEWYDWNRNFTKRVWKQKMFNSQEEEDKFFASKVKSNHFCEVSCGR